MLVVRLLWVHGCPHMVAVAVVKILVVPELAAAGAVN
jgi:hypothetical protein